MLLSFWSPGISPSRAPPPRSGFTHCTEDQAGLGEGHGRSAHRQAARPIAAGGPGHASCVLTSCPPPLHTLWSFRMRKGQKTLPLAWHSALAQHQPPHHVASSPRCQQSKGNDTKCIGNIFISKSIEGALKPYSILEVTFASRTDNKYAHPPALWGWPGCRRGRVGSHKYRIRRVSIKYHPRALIT